MFMISKKNEDMLKTESISYSNRKKEGNALKIIGIEALILTTILGAALLAGIYYKVIPNPFKLQNSKKNIALIPTPTIDHKTIPFVWCPVALSQCDLGKNIEGTKETPLNTLEYSNLTKDSNLFAVASGKMEVVKDGSNKTKISIISSERGLKVDYVITGDFLQSSNSAQIVREKDMLGTFKNGNNLLTFSVQSTITKKYIKVIPFQGKYLTTTE